MNTYKVKIKKGSLGDFETERWTEVDWEKHRLYVEELKANGEYLKEEEFTFNVMSHPLFDNPFGKSHPITGHALESYKFIMLDGGEVKKIKI